MRSFFIAVALALAVSPAQAWHHHAVAPAAKVVAPKAAVHAHHHGHKFICIANPAGFFICAVTVAIVVDEVKRAIDGPACATNKMTRQSYFGTIIDEPKLWRPLCNGKPSMI